jgi:hypothetical protein
MSNQIPTHFVKGFSSLIYHLSQQKGSRLSGAVRNETQKSEEQFWEQLGATTAILKTGRHMNTPQIDSVHKRRRVTLNDYVWADLIDSADKIRTLIDPKGPYTQAAMWAMGRAMDDVIIQAASGLAYEGKEGGTPVALPNTQKIASVASNAGVNLNVAALRKAKEILDANDVDESLERYIVVTASQLNALLGQTEVTSSDFNTVKALVQGQVDTFLGFKFIRTERLQPQVGSLTINTTSGIVGSGSGDANGYRKVIAFAKPGILLSKGMDVRTRVSERDDKNYSEQVFAEMAIGATRMEEEMVVEILCNEA